MKAVLRVLIRFLVFTRNCVHKLKENRKCDVNVTIETISHCSCDSLKEENKIGGKENEQNKQ